MYVTGCNKTYDQIFHSEFHKHKTLDDMFTYKWVFTKKSLLASQRATIWFWMYFTLSNEVHGKQPLKISYGVKFSLVLELIFLLLQLQTKISSSNTLAFCLHNENNRAIPTQNLNKISYSTAHRDWEFTHTVYECFSLCPYKKKNIWY